MMPGPVTTLDATVHAWVVAHRVPAEVTVAQVVTVLGSLPGLVVLTGALVVLVLRDRRVGRRPSAAALVAGTVALGYAASVVLKGLVGRARPPLVDQVAPAALDPSFPSGHALSTTVLLGMALLLCASRTTGRRRRLITQTLLIAAWVLVGASRVVLGYHWPSDVIGGWVIGTVLVLIARPVVRRALRVETRKDPGSPGDAEVGGSGRP